MLYESFFKITAYWSFWDLKSRETTLSEFDSLNRVHTLFEHAKAMGENALSFSIAARGKTKILEGSVVISVSELTAVYHMPKIVAKLRELEPAIDLEIVVTNESSDLKRREADIAIRGFKPTQPDLIAKKLGEEPVWFYGEKGYLAKISWDWE